MKTRNPFSFATWVLALARILRSAGTAASRMQTAINPDALAHFRSIFLVAGAAQNLVSFCARAGFDRTKASLSLPCVLTTLAMAAALAYTPYRYWKFDQFLSAKARVLSTRANIFPTSARSEKRWTRI